MTKKVIFDCDNTFSVPACDIDDGLAIIYTLAQSDVELLGISTTFGNNNLEVVYPNTVKFMKELGYEHIPVLRGSNHNYETNEAAHFLVEMAEKYAGELIIIATGSLTNLHDAWQLDRSFYSKVEQISLMGGITEPLIINGKILKELNFSCNKNAALNVLKYGNNITIATGNTCLQGFFTYERFAKLQTGTDFESWLYNNSLYWFEREKSVFNNEGIYIWDILAAAAVLNPHIFHQNKLTISPDNISMKTGLLFGSGDNREVKIPKIKNIEQYIEHVYQQFKKIHVK